MYLVYSLKYKVPFGISWWIANIQQQAYLIGLYMLVALKFALPFGYLWWKARLQTEVYHTSKLVALYFLLSIKNGDLPGGVRWWYKELKKKLWADWCVTPASKLAEEKTMIWKGMSRANPMANYQELCFTDLLAKPDTSKSTIRRLM